MRRSQKAGFRDVAFNCAAGIVLVVVGNCVSHDPVFAEAQLPSDNFYQLPLEGNYGNETGCNAIADKEPLDENMKYLTTEEYNQWERRCRFVAAYQGHNDNLASGSKAWTVITSCTAEGDVHSGLISVREGKNPETGENEVMITNDSEPVRLERCKP